MTIANSGHDENGRYHGGKAGDQTGHEWEIRSWYNRPWDCVLKPPTEAIGRDMALLAKHAANNDNIGYDQYERTTFYTQLMKAANYDPANIKVPCESDCSAGVAALGAAVGKRNGDKKMAAISKDCYTGNLAQAFVAAGWTKLTDSKYLTSDAYLGEGWVLLNTNHHTAINLTKGSKYQSSSSSTATKPSTSTSTTNKYVTGTYKITANPDLNVRKGAGTNYDKVKPAIAKGETAKVTFVKKVGNDWWGQISRGWICLELNGKAYVTKVSTSTSSSTTTSKKYATGKYVVKTASGINVRTGAGTDNKVIKAIPKGTPANVTEVKQVGSNWWGKISLGWICLEMNGTPYVTKA